MKIGDLAECAIWIDGTESDAMLRQWKADCAYLMSHSHDPVLRLGPVSFEIKWPGQDRVPQVPDQIAGPDVRLLVASAEVLGFEIARKASFLDELGKRDLTRLRAITRRQHGKRGHLTDEMCDKIIEQLGPVSAAETVRRGAVMLSVDAATDSQRGLAKTTLERMGPIDIEERAATWRAPGDEAMREHSPLEELGIRRGAKRRAGGSVRSHPRETTPTQSPAEAGRGERNTEPPPAQADFVPDEYLENEEDFRGKSRESDRS